MRRVATVVASLLMLCLAGLAWAQLSIESEVKSRLDAWVTNPPSPIASFRYRDVAYNLAERRIVVGGIELATGDSNGAVKIAIERIELVDFNPAAVEKILDPGLYRNGRGDGAFVRIASEGLVVGLRQTSAEDRVNLAQMRFRQLSGRQFAAAPTTASFSKDMAGKSAAMVLEAFLAESIEFSAIEIADGKGGGAKMSRVSFLDLDAGRIGEVSMLGLQALSEDIEAATTELIRLRGLDLRPALPDLVAGRSMATHDPARKPHFDEFRILGVGGRALDQQGIRLRELVATASRSSDKMTEKFTLRVAGLELRNGTAPGNNAGQTLEMLGYPSLSIDMDCNGINDYAAKTSAMEKCDTQSAGAATLSVKYKVGGVRSEGFGEDPKSMAQALQGIQLIGLQIALRDHSLVDRILTAAAKLEGKTLAAKRAEVVQQVRLGSAGFAQGSLRLQQAVQAVVAFVSKPETLTIELTPAGPVRFGDFNVGMAADPAAAAEKLGLSVKAGP